MKQPSPEAFHNAIIRSSASKKLKPLDKLHKCVLKARATLVEAEIKRPGLLMGMQISRKSAKWFVQKIIPHEPYAADIGEHLNDQLRKEESRAWFEQYGWHQVDLHARGGNPAPIGVGFCDERIADGMGHALIIINNKMLDNASKGKPHEFWKSCRLVFEWCNERWGCPRETVDTMRFHQKKVAALEDRKIAEMAKIVPRAPDRR